MDPRRTVSPDSALASDLFDKFCSANTLKGILLQYRNLCQAVRLKPTHFPDFFPRLKAKLLSWRAQGLWSKFEKRASQKCYNRGKACYGNRVLIIGAGPCGLRAAIEAQLLGAKVVLIEKRDRFSRNNVLHLWPFVITDLKALGAKKFYGKFCAGSIDHISIRQLQCILLKVALLLGVEVLEGVSFEGMLEPTDNEGWRAKVLPVDHPVSLYTFDVLIGADGRRNTLDGFKRKALRAKLAIAITANFINKRSEAEARVKEISGVSYIFNQKFFQELNEATGIDLENIVYYKDETHYFVMTAKKQSLLCKGVLLQDHADTAKLLSHENISSDALKTYALEAALFSTDGQLPNLDFAVNHYGQPDVAMFDFTAMYAAENACRVIQRKGHKLLMTLVGDSLLEPFWPTGSGCARGFLSSFDAAWMLKNWASGTKSVLEVIAERESIYRLLGQTTPENLNKEHLGYTIDPHSRYPNLNLRVVMPFQVKTLYESDEVNTSDIADGLLSMNDMEKATKKRRRDSVIAVDSLLTWLRDQVTSYGLEVSDVCDAFRRGDVLCAIINRFRPDLIEFPLPSEENVDPMDIASCRNQIAFDLLNEEHGLQPVMSGFEAVHCSSSDYLAIVAYLSQIYEIFRGEIPQIKYSKVDTGDESEEVEQRSSHTHSKYVHRPTLVVKHFAGKPLQRRSRLSSGREGKSDGESESIRKNKKRKSDERSRISVEEREMRLQEIEKNRIERVRRRMQERMLQTERFIKSMRLLQLNDRSGEIAVENDVDQSFEDYTFHLYRQMAPGFEERCQMLEQKLFCPGKDAKGSGPGDPDKQNVPGLAKNLEEKLKGGSKIEKKPKDLIRAIGKIEKSDWNVQLIEKKIAENKSHSTSKKDRDDKVPKWSREAFDDKREAMKRKMDGGIRGEKVDKLSQFDENVKKLGSKLREGNVLEVGQRGCNKVSQMANQLVNKLEKPKEEPSVPKSVIQRAPFEFPKKGGSETCHFCNERVYVVERMTTEGKFFHRNCFRCEYCNTSLRLGNYVYDREARYGEKFYCTPHYQLIRLYGWKKYDQDAVANADHKQKFEEGSALLHPASQQMLSEMDERGTTPERVEFENSVDFASEEELLSEMDEDEWTDRNFGVSNADDNNTSDEASDLSDDEELTPDGARDDQLRIFEGGVIYDKVSALPNEKCQDSSGSDTEVASDEDEDELDSGEEEEEEEDQEDAEDEEEEDEDEEEDEEEEEDCGGSTTEIETDSEFAEDPPHSVPGKIPTIVVDEPEQLVTKIFDAVPVSHTRSPSAKEMKQNKKAQGGTGHRGDHPHRTAKVTPLQQPAFDDVIQRRMQEPVKKDIPERILPRVNPVPKKWEPLQAHTDHLASKLSLELKQKYLYGPPSALPSGAKRPVDPAAQNQFRSVLDMISEQQKLLQPAAKPSATMQAFLEGAEKLKQKQSISPLGSHSPIFDSYGGPSSASTSTIPDFSNWSSKEIKTIDHCMKNDFDLNDNGPLSLVNMNKLNLEKTKESTSLETKTDANMCQDSPLSNDQLDTVVQPPLLSSGDALDLNGKESLPVCMTTSDTPSFSQSETDTPSTVVGNIESTNNKFCAVNSNEPSDNVINTTENLAKPEEDENQGSDDESITESGDHLSELELDDELDDEKEPCIAHAPPRVEIEDEFGVMLEIEVGSRSNDPSNARNPNDSEHAKNKIDDEGMKSVGLSSSDSRDSLNSGIFLESEMSDWTRDARTNIGSSPLKNKKAQNRHEGSVQVGKGPTMPDNMTPKSCMALDLSNLDFADMDGASSPEEELNKLPRKQGYCALANEEIDSDTDALHASGLRPRSATSTDTYTSNASSVESTPTAESVQEHRYTIPKSTELSNTQPTNPLNSKSDSNYAVLDRVVPFSNARDSLDYRKMKSNPSSPLKSKDLFSTYVCKGQALRESLCESPETRSISEDSSTKQIETQVGINENHSSQNLSPPDANDLSALKSSTSPTTIRRIEEINNERTKQSDLIRSMVMGRILRSPDKSRRNSRGSLSPLGASSNSGSGSSERFLKADDVDVESGQVTRRGSENSILSATNIASREETPPKELNEPPALPSSDPPSFSAPNTPTHGSIGMSNFEGVTPIIHPVVSHYEPIFTSSPRFRNRPKFDRPFSAYSFSVTNPPTPVNPAASIVTPTTPDVSSLTSKEDYEVSCHSSAGKKKSPSFYRSMPDLSATALTPFGTPSVRQWEAYKTVNLAEREKAREAARARARLKSDQELGLDQSDYVIYKDKLRRKISVPEDDVFDPDAAVVVSGIQQLEPNNRAASNLRESLNTVQTGSVAQTNPFMASEPSCRSFSLRSPTDTNVTPISLASGAPNETRNSSDPVKDENNGTDFLHLQLRLSSKSSSSERRLSPEKAKSVGWDAQPDTFPNYFTPVANQPAHVPPNNAISPRESHESSRPRSFTFSDTNFAENSRIPMGNKSFYFSTTSSPPQGNVLESSPRSPHRESFQASELQDPLPRSQVARSKAKSSEMLLDDAPLTLFEPSRGVSVPDISQEVHSPEKKQKKPKDRERRRSIIQTFSDFFGGKSASSNTSPASNSNANSPEGDKSSESTSSKEKFSLFKLTPKLLHKDRRISKSRDPLSPPSQSRSPVENAGSVSGKSGRGFTSYLSQPDIVIQRLAASPTPFKSSRASLNSRYESPDSASISSQYDKISLSTPTSTPWKFSSLSSSDSGTIKDIQELLGQVSNIEKELRILEHRGISIEKKLKGEEKDERNRDEAELMEEWFTLVRDKTRLARLEKKLKVEIEEIKLEQQQVVLQERYEHSINLSDIQKTPEQKTYEISLLHELHSLEQQKGSLLAQYHKDMQKLDSEDAALDEKIAASCISPRESNV